jgi:hypothetical protein
MEGLGPIEFFSTRGPEAMLLVISPQRTLAISPRDPEAFQQAFITASRQGVLDPVQPVSVRPDIFLARLWRDPLARTLLWIGIASAGVLDFRIRAALPELVPGFDIKEPRIRNPTGTAAVLLIGDFGLSTRPHELHRQIMGRPWLWFVRLSSSICSCGGGAVVMAACQEAGGIGDHRCPYRLPVSHSPQFPSPGLFPQRLPTFAQPAGENR